MVLPMILIFAGFLEDTTAAEVPSPRGDGTSAAVVSSKKPAKMRIIGSTMASNPDGGAEVQAFAIRKTLATLQALEEFSPGRLKKSYFVGHQANLRMLSTVCLKAE